MQKNLLFVISFIFLNFAYASIDRQEISLYQVKKTDSNIKKMAMKFEVVKSNKESLFFYVPRFKANEFEELANTEQLLAASIYANEEKENSSKGYREYNQVVTKLNEFTLMYPKKVKLKKYGESTLGNNLYYLKVSQNIDIDSKKPKLLITAATHGDELITTESLLRFLENFLANQATVKHQEILNNYQLFFILVVNPDGFMKRRRYTADGTDPNRSYPYPLDPHKKSVKCVAAKIAFFHSQNFVGSLDFHASGELIMFPWAYTYDSPVASDLVRFKSIGKAMSQGNGYKVGQISKIIYIAPASSVDYYYWKNGTISYGIELARSKAPRAKKIPEIVNQAATILYNFILSF